MRSCPLDGVLKPSAGLSGSCKPVPWLRVGLVAVLAFTLSGWMCSAIVGFNSCLGIPPTPQIRSLSPNFISANATSSVLIVIGDDFVPQSRVLWNGNMVATTFVDSRRLQVTITEQTLEQFGGSPGTDVLISVNSPTRTSVVGCPIGSSGTLVLVIN